MNQNTNSSNEDKQAFEKINNRLRIFDNINNIHNNIDVSNTNDKNQITYLRNKLIQQLKLMLNYTKESDDITIRFYDCKMGEEKDLIGDNIHVLKSIFGKMPDNPDIGMRGVRLLLKYDIFMNYMKDIELYALNFVAREFNRKINYMFPFITTNHEAKLLLDAIYPLCHENISFGFMVEVPSFEDIRSIDLLIKHVER